MKHLGNISIPEPEVKTANNRVTKKAVPKGGSKNVSDIDDFIKNGIQVPKINPKKNWQK